MPRRHQQCKATGLSRLVAHTSVPMPPRHAHMHNPVHHTAAINISPRENEGGERNLTMTTQHDCHQEYVLSQYRPSCSNVEVSRYSRDVEVANMLYSHPDVTLLHPAAVPTVTPAALQSPLWTAFGPTPPLTGFKKSVTTNPVNREPGSPLGGGLTAVPSTRTPSTVGPAPKSSCKPSPDVTTTALPQWMDPAHRRRARAAEVADRVDRGCRFMVPL
jgi:hypothetical protein